MLDKLFLKVYKIYTTLAKEIPRYEKVNIEEKVLIKTKFNPDNPISFQLCNPQ